MFKILFLVRNLLCLNVGNISVQSFWFLGTLKIAVKDLAKQIPAIKITNTRSYMERKKWKAEFYKFFAKTIWNTYFSILKQDNVFHPEALPRKKRELSIATPEVCLLQCLSKIFVLGDTRKGEFSWP